MKANVIEQLSSKQKKLKWYWWILIIVASMIFGAGLKQDKVITKEVQAPGSTVVKEVTKEADLTDWRTLKDKDDEIIILASESFGIVSEIFTAFSNLDVETAQNKTAELERMGDQMQKLVPERQDILKKLGY